MKPSDDGSSDALVPGLYEHLVSQAMASRLESLGDPRLWQVDDVDVSDAHSVVAQYLERILSASLLSFRGEEAADRYRRLFDRLVHTLADELGTEWTSDLSIATPLRRLLAIHTTPRTSDSHRPDTPLARSALLTGTRLDPSLGTQLAKEIATADRVDILCSFIRWSGLRVILDQLKQLTAVSHEHGPRLRIITTSYMGATDPRAVEALRELPNTEVRVSYDTKRTRLHAKAYMIHRQTGFGSAFVGSANLSHAALSEGLEWTTKISQYELSYLWTKIVATFENYWCDDEFEIFTEGSRAKLTEAIQRERQGVQFGGDGVALFNLRPYPFQEEILDVLSAERETQGKLRHLIVAATGTGKTMIAAFDYQRWSRSSMGFPKLLFIAHREEILRQALGTFRAVLRDHNFGELLVGGAEPEQLDHLFCSIQSYNSRELWRLPDDRFRYVVIDEFHHAAAPSYRRLIDHVQPDVLLGLTATPERTDELDVFAMFGGEASAEIRLPDAINRRLLCPFQYFGITDSVDLDGLTWQRGGYRTDELDRIYTGNDVRAGLVLDKARELLLDPFRSRCLGFCVSVAHAEFMARFFTEHGLPSLALSATSSDTERRTAQDRLRRYEINVIFAVDLYNEGIDIPELDTVLFLRPTESLTVYLQQLGRGLRLHDDKECLTVLDFIGTQRREFRFASRFRALSTNPTRKLDDEIEAGFPHLPSGCFIRLERVAQQRVLENVRNSLKQQRPRIVSALRELRHYLGRVPSIQETLQFLDIPLDQLLKPGLWSRLLADAGLSTVVSDPDERFLARGIWRLSLIEDSAFIRAILQEIHSPTDASIASPLDQQLQTMLHVTLWGYQHSGESLNAAWQRLRMNPASLRDIQTVLEYRLGHSHTKTLPIDLSLTGPLAVHCQYSRDEILVALNYWSMSNRPLLVEGVLHMPEPKVVVLFVTLQKGATKYSPTTMFEDYAVSRDLFRWQSQVHTSPETVGGKRYIHHREQGYTLLLFVREEKFLPSTLTIPYTFLGPCEYESHEGQRPMSILWKLKYPLPSKMLRCFARQAIG